MIYWAPFLHFYQPPTQFHGVLKKICKESYRPLVKLFEAHRGAKVTINICGVLTELLMDHGAEDVVYGMKELADRGQLEFVGSSKYHAILPLISTDEVRRQITLNHKANRFFFKKAYRPKGFFPPEMCYSKNIIKPIRDGGHSWMLLSGKACNKPWPIDMVYRAKSGDAEISVLFRDDLLSNKISFHNIDSKGFINHLRKIYSERNSPNKSAPDKSGQKDMYVITAMDAETFGHHIQNWEKIFLEEVYEAVAGDKRFTQIKQRKDLAKQHKQILSGKKADEVKVVTLSELFKIFPKRESIEPVPSSWSSTDEDIQQKNYYPLWKDPSNEVHKLQWEHAGICKDLVMKLGHFTSDNDEYKKYSDMARGLLDRALYSCQWWWASKRPMWDINLINKGLLVQEEVIFNAYKAILLSPMPDKEKKRFYYKVVVARDVSDKIRDLLFSK
ncbi:hypothetical protein ACFL0T_04400 [Candidatus Omnitrophota bacterium]